MQFSCIHCARSHDLDDNDIRGKTIRVRCENCSLYLQIEWSESLPKPFPVMAAPTPQNTTLFKEKLGKPEGAPSLIETFQHVINAHHTQDYDTWRNTLRSFLWRDREWFEHTFQQGISERLWERYTAGRKASFNLLNELTSAQEVELREVSEGHVASLTERLLTACMKTPIPLYTLYVTLGGKSTALRYWVYANGAWRFIGEYLSLIVDPAIASHIPALQKTEGYPAAPFQNSKKDLQFLFMELTRRMSQSDTDPVGLRTQIARCETPKSFFLEHFGHRGEQMAVRYRQLWPSAVADLLHIVQQRDYPEVEVRMREEPSELMESFTLKHLLPPNVPLAVVTLNDYRLLYWVYWDGAWRYTLFLPSLVQHADTQRGLLDAARQMQLVLGANFSTEKTAEIASLALPNAKQWFLKNFPEQVGEALFSEYQRSLDEGAIEEIVQEIAERQDASLEVACSANPFVRDLSGNQRNTLRLMTRPASFGRIDLNGYQLYSFVYADGAWRWIGKTRTSSMFEPSPLIDPLTEKYGDSAAELDRFLFDLHRVLFSVVSEGRLELLLGWLKSNVNKLLLPAPREWFAQSFAPDIAGVLQSGYETATPEEISSMASFAKALGLPHDVMEIKEFSSATAKSLAVALCTSMVGNYTASTVSETSDFPQVVLRRDGVYKVIGAYVSGTSELLQTVFQELYKGEKPVYWARHKSTTKGTYGAWGYLDGSWRYIGQMNKLVVTQPWQRRYLQRFPGTAEGLSTLFATLFQSFQVELPTFFLLLSSLRVNTPKPEWFANLDALIPEGSIVDWVNEYTQNNVQERQAFLAAASAVQYPDDLVFEVTPIEQCPDLFVIHCLDRRRGGVFSFFPLRYCDGVWRWLGSIKLQR